MQLSQAQTCSRRSISDAMPTILPPDVPWPLLRRQDSAPRKPSMVIWRGLGHGAGDSCARTCRLPRGACLRNVAYAARRVIKRVGEWPYKGLMSLVSLAGLILIGYGFGQYRA